MSITQNVVEALRAILMPELRALNDKVDANHREIMLRFDGMNQRFDDLIERLDLRRRIDELERERKAS